MYEDYTSSNIKAEICDQYSDKISLFVNCEEFAIDHGSNVSTVGSKIIRALAILLAIFLWFDCQFLSSHACY